jgi:hypothetical protein
MLEKNSKLWSLQFSVRQETRKDGQMERVEYLEKDKKERERWRKS